MPRSKDGDIIVCFCIGAIKCYWKEIYFPPSNRSMSIQIQYSLFGGPEAIILTSVIPSMDKKKRLGGRGLPYGARKKVGIQHLNATVPVIVSHLKKRKSKMGHNIWRLAVSCLPKYCVHQLTRDLTCLWSSTKGLASSHGTGISVVNELSFFCRLLPGSPWYIWFMTGIKIEIGMDWNEIWNDRSARDRNWNQN